MIKKKNKRKKCMMPSQLIMKFMINLFSNKINNLFLVMYKSTELYHLSLGLNVYLC